METADMVKVAVSAAPYSIDKPYELSGTPESLAAAAVPGVRVTGALWPGQYRSSEGLILTRVQEPKLPGSKAIRQISGSRSRCWIRPVSIWRCGCGAGISARCSRR